MSYDNDGKPTIESCRNMQNVTPTELKTFQKRGNEAMAREKQEQAEYAAGNRSAMDSPINTDWEKDYTARKLDRNKLGGARGGATFDRGEGVS